MPILTERVGPNTPIARSLGFDPRGVLIDNVTAYWLYFPQADQYCPPFTMRWSAPFILNMAGYGYMEVKTPFGQTTQTNVTQNISQYVSLTWTSQSVPLSPGVSIDPGDVTTSSVSPLVTVGFEALVPVSGPLLLPIIAANPVKRIRIHTVNISKAYAAGLAVVMTLDGIVIGGLTRSSTGNFLLVFSLDSERLSYNEGFTPGIDLDVNEGLSTNIGSFMLDTPIIGTVTYEYI